MKPTRLAALLLVLFTLPSTRIADAAEWKTSFGAELEAEGLYWREKIIGPDRKQFRGIFTGRLPTTIRYGKWRLRVNPYGQWDPSNPSSTERRYGDLSEAYLQFQSLPWTVQAGYNTFTWGDTDVFNPLDVVNPRRYFDPFRSEKIGVPSLMIKRDFEKFFVEAIYIPRQERSKLPGTQSRWMPRDVYRTRSLGTAFGEARIILPANLNYRYVDDLEVGDAQKNNLGLRMKFRLEGFDWTLAAYQGSALTPDVRLREITVNATSIAGGVTTVQVDPDIGLQAATYPIRMMGTSFTYVLGDFLVKGASAYTKVRNRRFDLPARIWENALGVERTFPVGKGSLTALAQGTYVNRGDKLDTSSISLARMFDEAGMGALRWAPSERWTVLLSYLRDLKFKGDLWHSEVSYKLADGWRAKLSGDLLDGPGETPIGTYKRNDRATASILAQF